MFSFIFSLTNFQTAEDALGAKIVTAGSYRLKVMRDAMHGGSDEHF
jgi:hypothetical protein